MKGSGKVHQSLAPVPKKKISTVYVAKPEKSFKVKKFLKQKKFKTLKKKIEKEVDDSDLGQLNSYKLCLAFIEKFIEKYDMIMDSKKSDKISNYSLFATMLASSLSEVNEDYEDIIDENDILNNNNIMNVLSKNPFEYLEKYIEYIEDEEILEDYEKVLDKYYNSILSARMQFNNNTNSNTNVKEEYIEYSGFIKDSVTAIKETIKEYSNVLKTKKKIANNINIDNLIMGLTAVKIKDSTDNIKSKVVKSNIVLSNDFLNRFMKLGL